MSEIDVFLISFFLCLIINYILPKYNFLIDKKFFPHKAFTSKNSVPISGGLIFILTTLLFLKFENYFNYIIFLIFFVGVLSDLNSLKSPYKRFFLQVTVIFTLVLFCKIFISSIRIPFFDYLLTYTLFKYFFVVFCLLILINGSNFIDGLNSLLISYLAIVIYILIKLNFVPEAIYFENNLNYFFLFLIVLIILNFNNLLMLGDAGAYLLSFFVGYLIIKSHNLNIDISPYFFINLIWLPCFENLFSIIRKFLSRFSPLVPDSNHLHQLIFRSLNRKIFKNKLIANNFSSIFIVCFNFLALYFVAIDPYNTIYQIKLTFLFIICYFLLFFLLKNET